MKQQYEQRVDAQNTGHHRESQTIKVLRLVLGLTRGDLPDVRRQIQEGRQRRELLGDVAERSALRLEGDRDIAAAVVAVDLGPDRARS